jgi:lipopolysaccharide/colanic/teichoic acid biosynthesis glycosyltransferase/biotin carboxylase
LDLEVKRTFDLIFGIPAFLILILPILIISLLILITDGKPVFFIQKRPGYKCKPFDLYKFRTMATDDNQYLGKNTLLKDIDRVTKLGSFLRKTSLDELPSIINVIKGEMSLVGPRPLLMHYLDLYDDNEIRRHDVKPGITGFAQISGRNSLTWDEKFKLDLWYVKNHSLGTDISILLKTVFRIFSQHHIDGKNDNDIGGTKLDRNPIKKRSLIENKKLLILGGNPETAEIVKRANELNVYTIVVDPVKHSPAKAFAKESFEIDGLDESAITKLAKELKVDGVLVGVADILVNTYQYVCSKLSLPCYSSEKIQKAFGDKQLFEEACKEHGIRTIPSYTSEQAFKLLAHVEANTKNKKFLVKPADSGGGVGMSIVSNSIELETAIKNALDRSPKKKFLIERLMQCEDMFIYYNFENGKTLISASADRITSKKQGDLSPVCIGAIYPSKYLKNYEEFVHPKMIQLFSDLDIHYGVLNLQFFVENDEFFVYDPGFRLQGEGPHIPLNDVNGINNIDMLINFSLTGDYNNDVKKLNDPYFQSIKYATIWVLLDKGKIGQIKNLEKIQTLPGTIEIKQRLFEGNEVTDAMIGNEKQVLARIYIKAKNLELLRERVRLINDLLEVYNISGESMILDMLKKDDF